MLLIKGFARAHSLNGPRSKPLNDPVVLTSAPSCHCPGRDSLLTDLVSRPLQAVLDPGAPPVPVSFRIINNGNAASPAIALPAFDTSSPFAVRSVETK